MIFLFLLKLSHLPLQLVYYCKYTIQCFQLKKNNKKMGAGVVNKLIENGACFCLGTWFREWSN